MLFFIQNFALWVVHVFLIETVTLWPALAAFLAVTQLCYHVSCLVYYCVSHQVKVSLPTGKSERHFMKKTESFTSLRARIADQTDAPLSRVAFFVNDIQIKDADTVHSLGTACILVPYVSPLAQISTILWF